MLAASLPVLLALAHPFGDPQTITVASDPADPAVVRVRWKAGGLDDLTLLGVRLGVLPQDRILLDGATVFEPADAGAIGPSAPFAEYLLTNVTVAGCPGVVSPPADLARDGVWLTYTCPAAVGTATVTVTTLTDLHPAYRTLATGPGGAHAVYSANAATHDWVLSGDPGAGGPSAGRSAAVQLGSLFGGLLLIVAAALGLRSRRRRRAATGGK